MNQEKMPLFHGLIQHAQRRPLQFHIPGHKTGLGMNKEFRDFIGYNALSIDLINIAPLDDLHHPHGLIKEAEELAAAAFGADYTYFSVQGTSGAIMAMVMSTCKPGDKVIVPRNVHKSMLNAIIFAGALPIFVYPEMDQRLGIAHGVSTDSVRRAIQQHPDAKAVCVINPTYFGIAADLRSIVQLAHDAGMFVLVDEAHGAHLPFHEKLPVSAMEVGADMAATSLHKLGGSLTGSSVLNIRKDRVRPEHVRAVFSMLTTTSTSYILLASLDAARQQLALQGHELIGRTIKLAEEARQRINEIPGLYCYGADILGGPSTFDYDPTKLTIHVNGLGISGYDVEKWLREKHNIEVELSDLYNILCFITMGDNAESIHALVQALQDLSTTFFKEGLRQAQPVTLPHLPVLAMSPRDAFYAETEVVPFAEAVGRIIAEFVMVYPPGIPILMPGEVIEQENLAYIQQNLEAGLPIQGPEDNQIQSLKVIKEHEPIR
ncbi:aminotransferase class I/II-fold pyridoxal phosphate-dependent enzyme [Rubeoparvulum massiliense]|uniref:aminotransferase class I/II-fold pyridoxal phosphate-dependent enzyme n=1 Tax=Rubeoparvulum massiliense TaxID=1631346 RepID=UPI00065E8165|nr:aminotransferase class I/II-fold pyridoxal phosphate-dependent enzyme [Rubeoparvulum massiliense]